MNNLILLCVGVIVLCVGGLALVLIYNKPIFLVYFQIVYCASMRFLISELHFPEVLRFLPDAVTLMLFVHCILCIKRSEYIAVTKLPLFFIGGFLVLSVMSFFLNEQPILSLIWGIRVVVRAFVFWFACFLFLRKKDVVNMVQILMCILAINALAASFQYFIQGYSFDYVGGLFGVETGSNTEMNTFIVQMLICAMTMFIYYKCGWKFIGLTIVLCVYIAAISELKVVFLEIPMIFFILLLFSGWKRRSILLLVAGGLAVYFSMMLFFILYPDWANFFNIETIMEYIGDDTGYAGQGTVNRMSSIPFVFENMFKSPIQMLFGYGLGNADSWALFTSSLYQEFGDYRYNYFGFSMLLAEDGVLGTICYLGFFASVCICGFIYRLKDPKNACWYTMAIVGSVLVVFHQIYSSTLRVDIIYNYMFWMSIPFIMMREACLENSSPGDAEAGGSQSVCAAAAKR